MSKPILEIDEFRVYYTGFLSYEIYKDDKIVHLCDIRDELLTRLFSAPLHMLIGLDNYLNDNKIRRLLGIDYLRSYVCLCDDHKTYYDYKSCEKPRSIHMLRCYIFDINWIRHVIVLIPRAHISNLDSYQYIDYYYTISDIPEYFNTSNIWLFDYWEKEELGVISEDFRIFKFGKSTSRNRVIN